MCVLGLGDISHALCMRISSVKPVPWLAVNLHHLFSNSFEFNTWSRSSQTSDAISRSYRRRFICNNESQTKSIIRLLNWKRLKWGCKQWFFFYFQQQLVKRSQQMHWTALSSEITLNRWKDSTTNISLSSADIQTNDLLWIWDWAEEWMLYQMRVITLAQSISLS